MYKIKTEIFKDYMEKNDLSVSDLASKCNVSASNIEKLLKNSQDLRLFTLLKILRALDIRFTEACYSAED